MKERIEHFKFSQRNSYLLNNLKTIYKEILKFNDMSIKDRNLYKNIIELNLVDFLSDFFGLVKILTDKKLPIHRKEAELYRFEENWTQKMLLSLI
ncbi:hypothetical protein [Coxiella endosymbiont of Ornithodoros maritimus]|uniref:hypothetical protein n=1 Tax=Coxiella endosymbiont of Ornithodoros maritimus TaxID=1656172 RepID=UPI002263B7C2|nr:hypothetical protein [Coxiella endosymbiont of Ornithodoros maritimus]